MPFSVPLRRLGNSGLSVSRLALGTMLFGARMDEAEARRMVDHAADQGLNFLDTADTYVNGGSEEIVGRAIAGKRHYWVVATKVGSQAAGAGPNRLGLSRKWIMEEVAASLKRLNTDFIDVLYLHMEDHLTPLEETVRAIADLQRSGSIRYFGVSNFHAWRIARICAICDAENIPRPIVNSPVYHALNRTAEMEILPACSAFGVGVFPWGVVARGILSGKYKSGAAPPEGSRAAVTPDKLGAVQSEGRNFTGVVRQRMMDSEFLKENIDAAAVIAAHARNRGIDPTAFAIAWALSNPIVTGVVAGPRTIEQWESYVAAFNVDWSPEDEALVNDIVRPATTAVPQFTDPMYPVEGRRQIQFGKPRGGPIHPGFGALGIKESQ